MCGITGLFNFDNRPITEHGLRVFNNSLAHRGPDGQGIWIDNHAGIGLGHRRLSIIDLSDNGRQPMTYANRYHMTYNGEIYNYLELKETLTSLGHKFETDSDAEVLIAAYAQWGDACLPKLNGMWAFAIWDTKEQELTICIDRFAVKSCVYIFSSTYFAFASEVKALLHLDRFEVEMDEDEMYRRMFLRQQDTVDTILEGVKRIPAGHLLKVRKGGEPKLVRWWNTLQAIDSLPEFSGNNTQHFLELFDDAVRLRMRTDRPFGIPLSGGMDSSSIFVLANRARMQLAGMTDSLQVFHMVKSGKENEEAAVDLINRETNANTIKIQEPIEMDLNTMQKLLYNNENIGPSSEGPYRIYQAMRANNIVVSLDGHGADELLAGYYFHTDPAMLDAISSEFNPIRAMDVARIRRQISYSGYSSGFKGLRQDWNYMNFIRRQGDADSSNPSIAHFALRREIKDCFSLMHEDVPLMAELGDRLNKRLYKDVHYGFLQKLLRSFDYASMANGVEARTPFLDWRLVCFIFSLPSKEKLGQGHTKLLLRKSMKGILPEPVRTNKVKLGFITNRERYFLNEEIHQWIGDTLHSDLSKIDNLVDKKKLLQSYNRYLSKDTIKVRAMSFYRVAQAVELSAIYQQINKTIKNVAF